MPFVQATTSLLEVIEGRDLGVVDLGGVGGGPVDALEPFYVSVGEQELGIAAALGASVVVAASGVGQPAFVTVNVHQGPHDGRLALRRNQGEKRAGGAEDVPDRIVVVVIRLGRVPQRILA